MFDAYLSDKRTVLARRSVMAKKRLSFRVRDELASRIGDRTYPLG